MARHVGNRAEGIDGIVVSQQEDWLLQCFAGEVDLQVIAEISDAVKFSAPPKSAKLLRHKRAAAVDSVLVVAGGFDLDQPPDGINHWLAALLKVEKAAFCWIDFGVGVRRLLRRFPGHR